MKKPTLKQIAEACGINVRTLQNYRDQGVDVYDTEAVRRHAIGKKNPPKSTDSAGMAAARERLIEVQIQRHQQFLDVARGKYVARDEVTRNLVEVFSQTRSVLIGLEREAPHWAGMDGVALHARARAFVDRALAEMHAWAKLKAEAERIERTAGG